jgi:hypothetical protein
MFDQDTRLKLLEQKMDIMQKEVSEVLQEMQVAIQSITITYSTALKVLLERVDKLENPQKAEPPREKTNGVEL